MKTFDPSFVHTVYFWLRNPDVESDREAFLAAVTKLLEKSTYAKTKFIGTAPKTNRDVVDSSFTYSLVVTFDSAEAEEAYQKEQAHLDFIEAASPLWKKVVVYDSLGVPD